MKRSITVTIQRPAKKKGGDRYHDEDTEFTIYIPQYISRPEGVPLRKIKVIFEGGDK